MVEILKKEALMEVLSEDFAYANVMFMVGDKKYKGEIIKAKEKIFSNPPEVGGAVKEVTSRIVLAWELKSLDEWGLLDYAEKIFEIARMEKAPVQEIPVQEQVPHPSSMGMTTVLSGQVEEAASSQDGGGIQAGENKPLGEGEHVLEVVLAGVRVNKEELAGKLRKNFKRRGISVVNAFITVKQEGGQYNIHVSGKFIAKKRIPSRVVVRILEALFFNLLNASVKVDREDIEVEVGEPVEYEIEIR